MFKHTVLCSHRFGQKKIGVDNTPHIIKKYLNPEIKTHTIEKLPNNLFKSLASIYHTNQKISGKRINIGGDHSITIGTGAYSLNKYKNTKFIWVDAHPDINTYEMSITKNIHGIPLAVLTGLENKFSFTNIKLPYKSIMYVGIRSIDKFEDQIIKGNNIQYLTVENIMKSPKESIEKIQDNIKDSNVHMSFDVDCLDPSIMTTTGTPVENGLFIEDIEKLINPIKKHITLSECHEFNIQDNINYNDKTVTKSIESLNSVFKIIF